MEQKFYIRSILAQMNLKLKIHGDESIEHI